MPVLFSHSFWKYFFPQKPLGQSQKGEHYKIGSPACFSLDLSLNKNLNTCILMYYVNHLFSGSEDLISGNGQIFAFP